MVNYDGQLYTIEGVAAGLIMLLTAFIVVGTTSVYTPGDTHIADMQLEQMGSDALHMMNTPNTCCAENSPTCPGNQYGKIICDENSTLKSTIINNDKAIFGETFLSFCNTTAGGTTDNLQYSADIYYRTPSNSVNRLHFAESRNLTGGEHAVRVTEWVHLTTWLTRPADAGIDRDRAVLVEVLVWRD